MSNLSPESGSLTLAEVLAAGNTAGGTAILAAVGSAALPGVAFEGDTDLGFYRVGANELGVAAAGALVSSFSAAGLALASGRAISLVDTSAGGTRLSMTMTPSGAWGGDIAHLEGVGPNFSGGAVLNLKSNDVHQSFLTMDNGTADIFSWTQAGVMTFGEGTYRTGSATGIDASDALHDFRGVVNQTGVGGYDFARMTWTTPSVGTGVKRGLIIDAPTGFVGDGFWFGVNGAEKFAVSEAGNVDSAGFGDFASYVVSDFYGVGNGTVARLGYRVDNGTMLITDPTDGGGNNNVILTVYGSRGSNHDHNPASAHPTFWYQSSTNPDVSNQEWGSATHTGAGFLFSSGPATGAGSAPTTIDNFIGFAPRGTESFKLTGDGGQHSVMLASGTVNTTHEINLDAAVVQTVTLDGATALSAANYSATMAKSVSVLITASGGDRAVTFPANWKWLGLKPTQVASGVTGMLSILSTSNADTGIVAAYEVLGTGA